MAADTGANVEGFKGENERDKCSSHRDLRPVSACNGDGKDDYVLVNGSDVCEDCCEESVSDLCESFEGSGANGNVDGLLEISNGDPVVDDPIERSGEMEMDSLEQIADLIERVKGGIVEVNGDHHSEIVNGDVLNNEVKMDNVKSVKGVVVESECDEDGELLRGNTDLNLHSEVVVENEKSGIQNGDVVEENCSKPLSNGFSHGESCILSGVDCNSLVNDTTITHVSNGDKPGNILEPCATSSATEVKIPCELTEDLINEPKSPKCEAEYQIAENNVQSHVTDLVGDAEQLDRKHQSIHEEVLEMQPSHNDLEDTHLPDSSVPQATGVEVKESLVDCAISVNQLSDYQQPELQLANGECEEPGGVEVEAKYQQCELKAANGEYEKLGGIDSEAKYMQSALKPATECEELGGGDADATVMEQGELELPEVIGNQEPSSKNFEAAISEALETAEGGEVKDQTVMLLTAELEGTGNEKCLESGSVGMERLVCDRVGNDDIFNNESRAEADQSLENSMEIVHFDKTDKLSIDPNMEKMDANGTLEFVAEEAGHESPVEDNITMDQVPEDSGSVDAQDKEVVLEEVGLERNMEIEGETSLSNLQAANNVAIHNLGFPTNDLCRVEAPGNNLSSDIIHSQTISVSGEDFDTVNGDELRGPVDITNSGNSVENNAPPIHAPDAKLQRTSGNDVDELKRSNKICKLTIRFGSFECGAPFSYIDVNAQPNVLNQSAVLNSSKSKLEPRDGAPFLTCEADGVHLTKLDPGKASEDWSVEHVSNNNLSTLPVKVSGSDVINGQNLSTGVVRRCFHYLIKIPRYDNEDLSKEISLYELKVDEKTQTRQSVRDEGRKAKEISDELRSIFEAAISEERGAWELVRVKLNEVKSAKTLINLARNAVTVEDVQSQILDMEHKIQHETLNLNEEKQLIREIKQLKILKCQLNADRYNQEKVHQALDQSVEIEERLKALKKELEPLQDKHAKARHRLNIAKKKLDEQKLVQNELFNKLKSADGIQQQAYDDLRTLKQQWFNKNKIFYKYKDDAKAANALAVAGCKDILEQHCVNQVEKIMELWNKDDVFRKEYIRCNTRSTLRRFGTLDGRSLGPNDDLPSIPTVSRNRETSLAKVNSVATISSTEIAVPREIKEAEHNSSKIVVEPKNKTAFDKKMAKTVPENCLAETSGRTEIMDKEKEIEEVKLTKEEIELAKKAEQQRREDEAIRLMEQKRLEEIAKAKEALERKKRMAEKAQARAEFRARKEAEEKEKERERRAKKKGKKQGSTSEIVETEPAVLAESTSDTSREPEASAELVTAVKRSTKAVPYTKQMVITKSVPPPLMRNRGRNKIKRSWWIVLWAFSILALFFMGDSNVFGYLTASIGLTS